MWGGAKVHVERSKALKISFLIPECGVLPDRLKSVIQNFGKYYLVKDLPLHEFVTHEFIDSFINKGAFYALSYNTKIDQDNTAAVLPTGKLILSLDKDTYEELGLQGRPSLYSGKKVMRYIVTIDLTDAAFLPDTKKHKRVLWALQENKPLKFDFLVGWHSADMETSTAMSYFSKLNMKVYEPKISSSILRDLHCPVLENSELQGKPEESCSAQELFDWLGAVSNNVDCNNHSYSFISTYCCPQPSTILGQACLCTLTGFIIPEKIHHLLDHLRQYFDEPKLAQWVTLTVHGFADSPISWRESEHGFHKGGENLYSFVVFNNQDYWLQMAVGTNDDCPP
ncbi:ribonuclease P protein subunit p40 isoform X3 [Rhinatrema bivittatum]|uniref:ribonuclease P protein subunit p40 isoform X3 n=1 Tax=Rhinatrema bivittatum TaxID=194408 RepID=UPI001125F3F0|nr:ribonuclease P protein subunit p40 isoform X3 [Rhinatrema bivittatum]